MSLASRFFFQEKYIGLTLWLMFFCYSVCMALIFQNVIIPSVSSLQGVGKLLPNDSVYFDKEAWAFAEELRQYGWERWRIFVSPLALGNVSIVGTLYAIFGHDPSLIIPLNSGLHALAGVFIFKLARELSTKKKIGTYSGIIASSLFVIFPSALSWYGQLHKDSYAIAGTLLLLLVWVKVTKNTSSRIWLWTILATCIACLLVGIVRPYGLTLMLAVSVGALFIMVTSNILRKNTTNTLRQCFLGITVLVILLTGVFSTKHIATSQIDRKVQPIQLASVSVGTGDSYEREWRWQRTSWLPDSLEKYISRAATTRILLINHGIKKGAQSTMDADIAPMSTSEVFQYLPRALQIAATAPFPTMWLSDRSVTRLLAGGEMFIYYLCLPGLFLLVIYNRKPETWMALYYSTAFLTILGFTIANMGTLYRARYAYFFILLTLGVLGWISFLERKGVIEKVIRFLRPKQELSLLDTLPQPGIDNKRKKAMGSGLYVMLLTLIGFIGFFYRDILMAYTYGLGMELDSFFVALLIPMTVVTIICMPLGAAFTPIFLVSQEKRSSKEMQQLVSGVASMVVLILFVVCTALYYSLPYLLPHVVADGDSNNLERIYDLTLMALPILFFSGPVILGNTILNAMGRVVVTGMAQLIVPVIAIMAVVIYGEHYGVQAAMFGMIAGQLLNLTIVQLVIKKYGFSLSPKYYLLNKNDLNHLITQYLPLVATAFFVSMAILVNTLLAMALPEGNVSVFSLGNKVVLLITGLVGAAISTVMLPYFSALIAKNHLVSARRELSVFLLVISFLSIPISTAFFIWAKQIIELIFIGNDFDVGSVARVMQYAVVQIPFFACNILLLKYATATKHVFAILSVAILGLAINVIASLFLMKVMGVAGIALAASLSMIVATALLVIILARYQHISLLDTFVLLLNWLLFITLLMSIHFESTSGIVVTVMAFMLLLVSYIQPILSTEQTHNET